MRFRFGADEHKVNLDRGSTHLDPIQITRTIMYDDMYERRYQTPTGTRDTKCGSSDRGTGSCSTIKESQCVGSINQTCINKLTITDHCQQENS